MNRKHIASILLALNAVTLDAKQGYTFASGIRSPIYCDNRIVISSPSHRKEIINAFLDVIQQQRLVFTVVCGTATAGIPWAAWLADRLDKPLVYARDKPKEHGRQNSIEGVLKKGDKVLIIEDLISTGGSALAACAAVRRAGADAVACLAIFTYGFSGAGQKFKDAGCRLFTLTDFKTLVEAAVQAGKLTAEDKGRIIAWNNEPEAWKP